MTVAILGFAIRVPGAGDEQAFWDVLEDRRCTVTEVTRDRFDTARFLHPRPTERGFSYTFAAGLIDDPLGFDHRVFGISPREVAQIDPQQRMLLEVTHEALNNAGLSPKAVGGSRTAVYVGASMLDYGNLHTTDAAAIEAHFMTGNSMSILSNRISYAFDLHGPSATIDTACSSGLVAFDEACRAIEGGRADLAVVAGVNLILTAAPYVGFSRAGMLSPTGRCRSFSAAADGYVRAEGAVSFILGNVETAHAAGLVPRAVVLASDVNSDGRTSGISLPSFHGQKQLLQRIYGPGGIDPDSLAFIEAHGTGTRVGDPIEATAIGAAIGKKRRTALPIGSVKSNVGHLEPASGLVGLAKAVLALEKKLLPASLHLDEVNPDIPFRDLGLAPAAEPVDLGRNPGPLAAAVSNFGFGGTNAHVVIREPSPAERAGAGRGAETGPRVLQLSAASDAALRAVAGRSATALDGDRSANGQIARALNHRHDALAHRAVFAWEGAADTASALRAFAGGDAGTALATAVSGRANGSVAFVYVGNATQHVGMGRDAFDRCAGFRDKILAVDAAFAPLAGWSLVEALQDSDEDRMVRTSFAQPMIFAIQSAVTAALRDLGVTPALVFGHSVGEVAAAEACGALSLNEAVRLIHARSHAQEAIFDQGGMVAAALSAAEAAEFCAALNGALTIAAINSPSSVTFSGSRSAIAQAIALAKKKRIAVRPLDIRYAFHSGQLEAHRDAFFEAVGTVRSRETDVPFVSSVTGALVSGADLGADYWWSNVTHTVQFQQAVTVAAQSGTGVFVEIGARSVLAAAIGETLRETAVDAEVVGSTLESRGEHGRDPVLALAAGAAAKGARLERERLFGTPPRGRIPLPSYPWQHESLTIERTREVIDTFGYRTVHPFLGSRFIEDGHQWRANVDTALVPLLSEHRLDGEAVMPAAGLAEIILAVGRTLHGPVALRVDDLDVLRPLRLSDTAVQEVQTLLDADGHRVTVRSRRRLSDDAWTTHAHGRVSPLHEPLHALAGPSGALIETSAEAIYAVAHAAGLEYGPRFRLLADTRRDGEVIEIDLRDPLPGEDRFTASYVLHPAVLDAVFHGLFAIYGQREGNEKQAFLPVQIAQLAVLGETGTVRKARIRIVQRTAETLIVSMTLLDDESRPVATLDRALFRAVTLSRLAREDLLFHLRDVALPDAGSGARRRALIDRWAGQGGEEPDAVVLLDVLATALAHETLRSIVGDEGFTVDDLAAAGQIGPDARGLVARLLQILEQSALVSHTGWLSYLARDAELPASEVLLRTLMADYPECGSEIAAAAQVATTLAALVRGETVAPMRSALADVVETAGPAHLAAFEALRDLVAVIGRDLGARAVRILVCGTECPGLVDTLMPSIEAGRVELTVVGPDKASIDKAKARARRSSRLRFVVVEEVPTRGFDLALAIGPSSARAYDSALAGSALRALARGASLVAFRPTRHAFGALVRAVQMREEASSLDAYFPLALSTSPDDDVVALESVGFEAVASHEARTGTWVVAGAPDTPATTIDAADARPVALICAGDAAPLAEALRARGRTVKTYASVVQGAAGFDQAADLVLVVGSSDRAAAERLTAAAFDLIAAATGAGAGAGRLWAVTAQGFGDKPRGIEPGSMALQGFLRVLANEIQGVDIRGVDLSDISLGKAAERLADLIDDPGDELAFILSRDGVFGLRAERGLPVAANRSSPAEAAELAVVRKGSFDALSWRPAERRAPRAGEIQIAVAATGLNFRDVMFSLGLLPEEILAGGFAGAVVGFECAGRVAAIGPGVRGLAVGDAVMAFAPGAFSTHVTIPRAAAVPVPAGVPLEAAATIPVAFATAWFALIEKAALRKGEWVLIHGAAGGVGLAAIQIAKARGARVAATAGAPDKRALARLCGADRVYDSRSLAFAQELARDVGGVDVVLNSLAGEAMELSFKALKPFGRFVELGKRDFVENTQLGLRPFRQNLSYFGVDLDQLLAHDQRLATAMMRRLRASFERGDLRPLPYRAFEGHDAAAAFRLMQASGHVGKIVVRPPRDRPRTDAPAKPKIAADGVHIVFGGLDGLGLETALWLTDQGARTVIAVSRRGVVPEAHQDRVAALKERGITFVAEALDITQFDAVRRLVTRVAAEHGPIRGIFHTAAVLDDGLLSNATPERFAAVLAPKVSGIDNIERALKGVRLDYFVVYSSVSALIGNPGQGAYVAANAYLEGVVRRRRAAGLPGLAIAWGRIVDVGLVARNAGLESKVSRVLGDSGLRAADALALLGDAMAQSDRFGLNGTVVCAPMHAASALAKSLPVIKSPTFAGMQEEEAQAGAVDSFDLRALIARESDSQARETVASVVAEQVARILRVATAEIDLGRPLSDLGLDSLMALELRLQLDTRLGVELPLVAISAGQSLRELSGRIVAIIRAETEAPGASGAAEAALPHIDTLLAQHTTEAVGADGLEALHSVLAPAEADRAA